jgi:hypothetical protein
MNFYAWAPRYNVNLNSEISKKVEEEEGWFHKLFPVPNKFLKRSIAETEQNLYLKEEALFS